MTFAHWKKVRTNNKNSKLEKNGNTKVLSIENLTEWLENPSPNRSFYSLSLVFNIIMLDEPNITVVSNKIFKTLEDKKINTSVETIYENIIRLWNDASSAMSITRALPKSFCDLSRHFS